MTENNKNKNSDDCASNHNLLNTLSLPSHIAVVGAGILKNNLLLEPCLQTSVKRWYPWSFIQNFNPKLQNKNQGFIGWGNKKSFQRASKYSKKQALPVYSIEDGFLRSLDTGINSKHAVSLVVDDLGIYFNAYNDSRLERLILHRCRTNNWSQQHLEYSQTVMSQITDLYLSKYNQTLACLNLDHVAHKNSTPNIPHVLVIDQVVGDHSVSGAGADSSNFLRMIEDACRNHPNANIWIKAHPASHANPKKGYLTALNIDKKIQALEKHIQARMFWITDAVNPIKLLQQVSHVYTVSSHMGFEALLLGKTVHCYGVNWYSGWGLTDDKGMFGRAEKLLCTVKKRRNKLLLESHTKQSLTNNSELATVTELNQTALRRINLEQLFFASYLDYSDYVDPATKKKCDIETAIKWLDSNRQWSIRLQGDMTVYEFSRWKVPFVKSFTNFPQTNLLLKAKQKFSSESPLYFLSKTSEYFSKVTLHADKKTLVWGFKNQIKVQTLLNTSLLTQTCTSAELQKPIYCMEDGFVRSNGLGATLLEPLSVVLDESGIYYNATQHSDLEALINNASSLSTQQINRVNVLHSKLLANKVSKYNVGKKLNNQSAPWLSEISKTTKRKVLIVGQVEDDLSIHYCGSLITSNAKLIQRVAKDNPQAFLIYKPHPDVEAGLRVGKVEESILTCVDVVATDISMPDCLELVTDIHTISSLTGFEGLLRNKFVHCYGLPFYAGWGLTVDIDAEKQPKATYLSRRQRTELPKLTLQQLIYCTLIEYPLYRIPTGHGLAQVEQVIAYLYDKDNEQVSNKQRRNNIKKSMKYQFMKLKYKYSQKS